MKQTEFRIGNIVKSKKFNKQVSLTLSDFAEANRDADGSEESSWFKNNIEPIPLTEELLWNLGFVCDEDTEIFELGDVTIDIHGDKFVFAVQGTEECSHETRYFAHHTKNIHQLQNLYYALTGRELVLAANA